MLSYLSRESVCLLSGRECNASVNDLFKLSFSRKKIIRPVPTSCFRTLFISLISFMGSCSLVGGVRFSNRSLVSTEKQAVTFSVHFCLSLYLITKEKCSIDSRDLFHPIANLSFTIRVVSQLVCV